MNIIDNPPKTAVRRLLREAGLPVADIDANCPGRFFGCESPGKLLGVVGLELHGDSAVLRSLAVDPRARSRGLGTLLVARAERAARAGGAHTVYLLTTTAEDYFLRLGYARLAREAAPECIRSTAEFSRLCPADAALLAKSLHALPRGLRQDAADRQA